LSNPSPTLLVPSSTSDVRSVWLDTDHGPLHIKLHQPAGGVARGGVVLCPPIGIEHQASYYTFRRTAELLCAAGIVALRFDYPGTGDSAGDLSVPQVASAWSDSVVDVTSFLRNLGVDRVGLVGMRVGANLVMASLGRMEPVDAVLLWDPTPSGRHFLRSQQALYRISMKVVPTVEETEIPGYLLGPDCLHDLEKLSLSCEGEPPPHLHVLGRTPEAAERLARSTGNPTATSGPVEGQAELIDVSLGFAKVPDSGIAAVTAWFDALGWPSASLPVTELASEVILQEGAHLLVERSVCIGAPGIFGIVTEPLDRANTLPTIFFVNVGIEHHIGPGRMWVYLARDFATRGYRCVRFDLTGLGDSATRSGRLALQAMSTDALDDVEVVVRSLVDDPKSAVLVGLCSGAYHALEVGHDIGAAAVCALNISLDFTLPTEPSDVLRRRVLLARRHPWVKNLTRRARVKRYQDRVPPAGWWLLDHLGILRSPARGILSVAESGVPLLVVCGDEESWPFERRGGWILRRASKVASFRFERIPSLEHSLLVHESRVQVRSVLTDFIVGRFGPSERAP
jgi:pimeloyl-ACP methyl ester carboxylesterase